MRIVPSQPSRDGGNDNPAAFRFHRRRLGPLCAVVAAAAGMLAGTCAFAAPPGACDVPAVVAHALPAVVNISVVRVLGADASGRPVAEHFELFVGSGAIVDPSGLIVTNKHVIQDAAIIRVTLQDRTQVSAQLVAAASLVDLAVLKISVPRPLPTLSFDNSDALKIGQPVIAVGNPLGIGTSVSTGVVSGVNRNLMRSPFDDYIQTDASINPGNSGGPLLDCAGKMVGVDSALVSNNTLLGSIGLGFALPANDVSAVVNLLRDPSKDKPNWVGLHLQDVSALLAVTFHMPIPDGAIVTEIDPDSPAAQSSLVPGDIITAIDGEKLPDSRAIQRVIVLTPSGQPISFSVWRDGHMTDLTVRGKPWPHMMALRSEVLASPENIARAEAVGLGLYVSAITPADRRLYGLGDAKGVLIDQVISGSQAENMNLHAGDVIEQVGPRPATSADQVTQDLMPHAAAPGRLVALLVRGKTGPKWAALWVGRIDTKDLVAGPLPSEASGTAHDVSGKK